MRLSLRRRRQRPLPDAVNRKETTLAADSSVKQLTQNGISSLSGPAPPGSRRAGSSMMQRYLCEVEQDAAEQDKPTCQQEQPTVAIT